jgi:hypothetical protein
MPGSRKTRGRSSERLSTINPDAAASPGGGAPGGAALQRLAFLDRETHRDFRSTWAHTVSSLVPREHDMCQISRIISDSGH